MSNLDLTVFQNSRVTFSATGMVFVPGMDYGEWAAIGATLQRMEMAVQFALGDWLNYGESAYGEKYAQALEETEYAYKTLRQYAWVSSKVGVSMRIDTLGFQHHELIAPLTEELQSHYLKWAEDTGATVRELRYKIKGDERALSTTILLPPGTFNVIYADPPWQYSNTGLEGSAESHYATLETGAIGEIMERLKVRITEPAALFLWATNPLLEDALRVINAWGFDYKSNIVWVKPFVNYGKSGWHVKGHHELLLLATRGGGVPEFQPQSVVQLPRAEHSRKPDYFRELIEAMYPGRNYLELFSRGQPAREQWVFWGNEQ